MNDDVTSFSGATALAKRIESHWRTLGYELVSVCVVQCSHVVLNGRAVYGIRSNISGHGYPPRRVYSGPKIGINDRVVALHGAAF